MSDLITAISGIILIIFLSIILSISIIIVVKHNELIDYKDTLDNRAFEINAAQYNIKTGKVEYIDPEVKYVLTGER